MNPDDLFELRAELRRLQVAVSGLEVIVKVLADKILGDGNAETPSGLWKRSPSGTDKTAKRKRR